MLGSQGLLSRGTDILDQAEEHVGVESPFLQNMRAVCT